MSGFEFCLVSDKLKFSSNRAILFQVFFSNFGLLLCSFLIVSYFIVSFAGLSDMDRSRVLPSARTKRRRIQRDLDLLRSRLRNIETDVDISDSSTDTEILNHEILFEDQEQEDDFVSCVDGDDLQYSDCENFNFDSDVSPNLSESMLTATIRNMTQEMNHSWKKVVMRKTRGTIFVIYLQCNIGHNIYCNNMGHLSECG